MLATGSPPAGMKTSRSAAIPAAKPIRAALRGSRRPKAAWATVAPIAPCDIGSIDEWFLAFLRTFYSYHNPPVPYVCLALDAKRVSKVTRLRDRNGTIRTKLGADDAGSALIMMDDRTEASAAMKNRNFMTEIPEVLHDVWANKLCSTTCDGRLLFGGMWGDVAPWVFRSVSDTAFEAIPAGGIGNDRLEFQVGWNGMAHAVAHTLDWKKSPLVRLRDLPDKLKERECP